jgi:hypothetical protein
MPSQLNMSSASATRVFRRRSSSQHLLGLLRVGVSLYALAVCSTALGQTPTTTFLAVSSNGNTVSTVSAGSLVTLTASVQAGSTPITQGQVILCDVTASHCTDIHLLGTAQLNSSGKSVFHLRPGAGSYSYVAQFLGTPKTSVPYGGSVSSAATLSVTGLYPTATTIAQTGSSGDYALNASVYGFTKSTSAGAPTGLISFLDTTTNNSVLGTAIPAPSGTGPFFVNSSNTAGGTLGGTIVAGDFNGDGNLDIALGVSSLSTTVVILLGDGKGNFVPVTSSPITAAGTPLLVQDFNGDGIPDLLLSSLTNGTVTVLLGNGDGTFRTAAVSPISTNYGSSPVATADFNGDGIPDLAIAGGYYLIILLGKGDGTFTEVPTTSSISPADLFNSMVVGDYNGDGIPDLAIVDTFDENLLVFLGNGDGTFKTGSTTTISTTSAGSPVTLTTGDFNGDGKLDLAVPIYGTGEVAVFLGNGDGTFHAATGSPISLGQWTSRIAVGDFNGDGIADLLVGAQTSGQDLFVLLGKGDGTFVQASIGSTGLPCCLNTVLGDFNGDGVTDIAASDFYAGAADVFLAAMKQSTASITGVSVTGQSPQQVIASYPGDANYSPSESSSTSLLVQAAAPEFSPAPGVLVLPQTITLTSSTPGASIYYQISGALQTNGYLPFFGPISVSNVGTVTIQAYAVGNNYGQSSTSSATYSVSLPNPAPVLNSMSPAFMRAEGSAFSLTISGSGFISGSTVYWGTTALTTQYVSATQLTAQITASEIATAGIASITVNTPAPGGGVSNALQFELDSGGSGTSPSFTTASQTVTRGSTASYPVTLPSSATNVTVSCLNLPSGASCSYSATANALTIATAASTSSGNYQITAVFTETLPGSASALAFAPFLLLPLTISRKKRRREHVLVAAFALALLGFVASGCGGSGGGGTPPTHQVTSSGVVTLTVQ